VLTSSVGIIFFYSIALLGGGEHLYAKPWHKSSHTPKSPLHTHGELIEINSHSLFSK
jgi:hypothetical protein